MQHYVLGDVITEISERENNPSNSEYERFVGLEHYVSGEVEIENYGSTANLNSAMKVFNSGDILVARRNVYLKRASVVYFDGLTSGDSIVLRPKNETIGRILPFILNTDDFWDYADQYSDGTMSKRLSPKVLKQYEFDLPDDNLEQLADILWAMVDVKKSYQRLLKQTDELVKSQFIEMFGELDKNTKRFPVRKLSEISSYWNGLTYKPADAVEDGTGTLVLRSSNIQNGALAFEDNVYVNCEIKEKLLVQENDILMCSRNGSAALVGKTALIKGLVEPTTFGAFMMIIRSEYYSYLKTYFEMPFFRNQISTGTSTINQITGKMLNEISLPVPDMDTVRMFESFVHQSDKSKFELKQAIEGVNILIKSMLQQELN